MKKMPLLHLINLGKNYNAWEFLEYCKY